jgi:hypothetical protein
MLKWPDRAKVAIRKLFEPLQSIDVYIEDSNDEAFYRTLLHTVSKGKVTIARVFALGGRQPVIDAAMAHDHLKRRALFLIDGDLEWVRGLPAPHVLGIHRHDAYCIENLLFCEKALVQILSQDAVLTEEEACQTLELKSWINSIQGPLLELFSAFATSHEFAPEIKTVSLGVGNLCTKPKKGATALDIAKVVQATTKALAGAETKADKKSVQKIYSQTLARLKSLKFPLHAVSGKDFLIPLVDFLLQSHGCRIKRKSLRMRMASSGDIDRFNELHVALTRAALGQC